MEICNSNLSNILNNIVGGKPPQKRRLQDMRFCIVEDDGRSYFMSIDEASKLLGISRRTFFQYLPQVNVKPEEKKRVGQKFYFAEDVIARMWVLQRRFGRTSNGGLKKNAAKASPEKGGAASKAIGPNSRPIKLSSQPIETSSKPLSVEQKQAAQQRVAEILAKV
jgi:DNA-binding transcriptional MerR regulator